MRKAKKPFSSRGAFGRKSRYAASTSAPSSTGQNVGPATTVPTSCSLNRKEVTTPKLPPRRESPRRDRGARPRRHEPSRRSASTTSASSRLSIVRPHLRVRCPRPPPSVRPPTPVVEMIPLGVARPCSLVAASTSPQVQPPPTLAVRAPGSTATPFRPERSRTTPSSHVPNPAPLWPPPRTASKSSWLPANETTFATSPESAQAAIKTAAIEHQV